MKFFITITLEKIVCITVKTITVFGKCSEITEFLKCNMHHTIYPYPVAMKTFDLEVYSLHLEGVFFQLNFKNHMHPCFNSSCIIMYILSEM